MQRVIFIFILFLSLMVYSSKAAGNIDSLQYVLEQTDRVSSQKTWLALHLSLAKAQVEQTQYDPAIINFQIVINSTTEDKLLIESKIGLGEIYYLKGNYERALSHLQSVLNQETSHVDLKGEAIRLAAMNHVFLGNYPTAYQLQIDALQIFNHLKDTLKIARVNYDIANTYFYQEQYQVALTYFEKALETYKAHQDIKGLFRCYAAMGSVYGYLNQFDKSLAYNEYALNNARENGNKQDISWALLNVGANYYSKKHYQVALDHLLEGLALSRKNKDDRLTSNILVTISRVYTDTKKFDLAINHLEHGLALTKKSNDRSNLREIYKWFAETYYEKGNLEKYHYYIDQFIAVKDTLYNEEVMSQINNMQQSFELQNAEREKEIALLKKNEEIQRLKENSWIGGAILSLLILSLILVLMYNRNKNQKTLNGLLAQKNEEILKQNERLANSNRDLEQFAHIISHDLKEPLRNISGFTSLLKRRCNKYQDQEASEYMGFVFQSVNQMHQLLTDLLDYSKISSKIKEQKFINADHILKNALSNLQHRIQEEKAHIQVEALPLVKVNPSQLLQVFQNLIANAIKFKGNVPPVIQINCITQETDYLFSIQDNGIGIEAAYFDKIFVPFQRLHHRGEYEGSGIGLSTCKKIIEEHGGKIWIKSEVKKGSTFYFTLPKHIENTSTESTSSTSLATHTKA